MPEYLSPGVFVEEVPGDRIPIGGVGFNTAGFVGVSPDADAHLNEPIACNNWTQFRNAFVKADSASTDLARAVYSFFENGGSRCFVVNVGVGNPIAGDARSRSGLASLEPIDEVAIVAAPGYSDPASHDALLSFCERMGDRIAVLDAPADVRDTEQLKKVATLVPTTAPDVPTESTAGADEEPAPAAAGRRRATRNQALRPRTSDRGYGAFYFPWYSSRDPFDGDSIVLIPPSGAVVGIYARVGTQRGIHKAPANEVIKGALGLPYQVTRAEQGDLNRNGVNCIRVISNAVRVWGARTLAPEASEYRYVNVRRLLNFLSESIKEGTNGFVFEPNDEPLRQSVCHSVRSFLKLQWRSGALMGRSPEEAFHVKCDAENNPPEVVDAGQLVVDIYVAPVKPAEFVVFRIAQKAGNTEDQAVV